MATQGFTDVILFSPGNNAMTYLLLLSQLTPNQTELSVENLPEVVQVVIRTKESRLLYVRVRSLFLTPACVYAKSL